MARPILGPDGRSLLMRVACVSVYSMGPFWRTKWRTLLCLGLTGHVVRWPVLAEAARGSSNVRRCGGGGTRANVSPPDAACRGVSTNAGGGTRTHTTLRPRDFESQLSVGFTNSCGSWCISWQLPGRQRRKSLHGQDIEAQRPDPGHAGSPAGRGSSAATARCEDSPRCFAPAALLAVSSVAGTIRCRRLTDPLP